MDQNSNIPSNFILQWNCNGFFSKLNNLKLLNQLFSPSVICIQETCLSDKNKFNMNTFNCYRHDFVSITKACNGVLTLVHKSLYSVVIPIQSPLQVIAVKVFHPLFKFLSICNIYIPSNVQLSLSHLQSIYNQLPKPCIIVGDVNAHHSLWGSPFNDPRGDCICSFLDNNIDIGILNNGSHTHFNLTHRVFTHIDISLVSSSLLPHLHWEIHDDLHFSDHFPILVSLTPSSNLIADNPFRPWSYGKANWCRFRELSDRVSHISDLPNIDQAVEFLNQTLLDSSSCSIPKCVIRKKCVPWWCDEIRTSIKSRKKAFRQYRRHPSDDNFILFKRCRAQTRLLIQSKRNIQWVTFLNTIDRPLDQRTMWKQLKRIKGKYTYNPITIIKNSNNEIIGDTKEQCEIFARHFSSVSKSSSYHPDFQTYKFNSEKSNFINPPLPYEPFNLEFKLEELQNALKNCKSSATGVDNISYPMLQNLSPSALDSLLALFNQVWTSGSFPEVWRNSIIVPIHKPGRDPLRPINYRPISLISCVSKTLEKMVNLRLRWILESRNLLNKHQNGCIRNKSVLDSLAVIQHYILFGFACKQPTVMIGLDIEKAFDLTWRHKVLKKLDEWNIHGRMFTYLQNFLFNRKIQVKIKNMLSSPYELENGILQGSSLSATLWNIVISDITSCFPPQVNYSIYVDDIILYMTDPRPDYIQSTMQNILNDLVIWSRTNGPKFSEEKTKLMVFHKGNNPPTVNLQFNGITLQTEKHIKILGMIFDPVCHGNST
ncbi:hypothetical protein WDU94_012254 [Cyamophila willieti]